MDVLCRADFTSAFAPQSCKNSALNLIKLTFLSLAGWMNLQQQDVIDYLRRKLEFNHFIEHFLCERNHRGLVNLLI
ncbi:MAG: hypothetical protein ACI9R3_005375 [Verrucomicrobiales bacterium]